MRAQLVMARLPTAQDSSYSGHVALNEYITDLASRAGVTMDAPLPTVGDSQDQWGTMLNACLTELDAKIGTGGGSGYGIGGYGDSTWDTSTITQGYNTTSRMQLAKMIYGQVGWGQKLNDNWDAIDVLAGRISAMEPS
jgi:hypothetical protein